jgi:uncharacterized membrane protein YiaA
LINEVFSTLHYLLLRLFNTCLPFAAPESLDGTFANQKLMGGSKMNEREAEAAWRLIRFNWQLVAGVLVAFGLGLLLTNFHVQPLGYLIAFVIAAVYGLFGYYNVVSPERRHPRIFFPLTAIAQMILIVSVMVSITYIATSVNFPLKDATLLALDRAIGLDFRAYLNFINDRQWLIYILATGYRAISWPICVIVIALPLAGYYRRTGEFICAFTLALIATTCISTLIPATGIYGAMGLLAADFPNIVPQSYYDGMREIPALRDGSLRELNILQLGGVLTFPSFHAISAVLYTWAFWPVRWFRPLNLLCNGVMIAATPVGGGHFFVDVIAGIALAAASIFAARRIHLALATADVFGEDHAIQQPPPWAIAGVLGNRIRVRIPN